MRSHPSRSVPALLRASVLLNLLAVAPATLAAESASVEVLAACPGASTSTGKTIVLFDGTTDRLSGWSHIPASREYEDMRLPASRYQVGPDARRAEPDCGGAKVFETVLVKKYADWDRQHANGLEPRFSGAGLRFGDIAAVVLELRLKRADSAIPTPAELTKDYGAFLGEAERAQWDGGKANLGFTFFEAGFDEQTEPSFTAARIVEIDPATQGDRWLRVTVPMAAMDTYTEQNWAPTPRALADFAAHEMLGLRINPETRSGKVLRNFRNPLPEAAEERFKEMAIEIRRLEVRLR